MLRIGEFAHHAGVSVRMLRHYDALGLLVPAYVDPATGYRGYAAAQLARANRLVALKELGFTLERVGPILDAEVGVDELRGMLLLLREQVSAALEADRARLAAIEARLRLIESEEHMSGIEYVEKPLPAVRLAQLTAEVDGVEQIGPEIGPMFGRLMGGLHGAGVTPQGPAVAWYAAAGDGLRIGAGVPTTLERVAVDGVEVEDLPAEPRAVTMVYRGSMAGIVAAWQALTRHVEALGLPFAGRAREVYLDTPEGDEDAWVTELQQPVG